MFCVKCGTEIDSSDLNCPKCGAKNEYYSPQKEKRKLSFLMKQKQENPELNEASNDMENHNRFNKFKMPVMIVAIFVCIVTAIFFGLFQKKGYSTYRPKGTAAMIDKEGTAFFVTKGRTVSFTGGYSSGIRTPDQKKYVLLNFDGTLQYYSSQDSDPVTIASNVERIMKVTDGGCVYAVNDKVSTEDILKRISSSYKIDKSLSELNKEFLNSYSNNVNDARKFYLEKIGSSYVSGTGDDRLSIYNFKNRKTIELECDSNFVQFADHSLTFAKIDHDKKLSVYVAGTDSVKELCAVGDDATLCGVSSDGKNIIWSNQKNDELLIYMIKNNVPERIGSLGEKERYILKPRVVFFEKGFAVTCYDYDKLIFSKNDKVKEVSLGGVLDGFYLLDDHGNPIDNSPSDTDCFYYAVDKSDDYDMLGLYKLDLDGNVKEVISKFNTQYYIKGDRIYYINDEDDFCAADLTNKGISNMKRVTTEVSSLGVSDDGKVVYLGKAGGLYYWNTNDKSFQLNQISSDFEEEAQLYVTDDKDVLFYLTDITSIPNEYSEMGNLYYYKKGMAKPQEVASNVYSFRGNDSRNISSTNPIIIQYSKHNSDGNALYNFGLFKNKQMEIIISDILY